MSNTEGPQQGWVPQWGRGFSSRRRGGGSGCLW